MTKKEEKLELYKEQLKKYVDNIDEEKLTKIVDLLGPSIYKKDSETVACSDEKELERVLQSSVLEKLGVKVTMDDIKAVCERMKWEKNKYRAVFYYLLTEIANKS
jgi:hypothetical protein